MSEITAAHVPTFERSALAEQYLARFDLPVTKEIMPIALPRVIDFSLVARRIPVYDLHRET